MDEAWTIVERDAQGQEKALCVPLAMGMAVNELKKFANLRAEQLGVESVVTGDFDKIRAVVGSHEFHLMPAY